MKDQHSFFSALGVSQRIGARGLPVQVQEERPVDMVAVLRVLGKNLTHAHAPGAILTTGTNLIGVLQIAAEMRASGKHGSIVTLICDSGQRYEQSYFNDDWLKTNGFM